MADKPFTMEEEGYDMDWGATDAQEMPPEPRESSKGHGNGSIVRVTSSDVLFFVQQALNQFPPERMQDIRFVYGIPNSGKPVAYLAAGELNRRWERGKYALSGPVELTDMDDFNPRHTLVVDDVYASGKTMRPFLEKGFAAIVAVAKSAVPEKVYAGWVEASSAYVVFPWEGNAVGPEDAVRRLLEYLGCDPDHADVRDTPRRVLDWLSLFKHDKPALGTLTSFDGMQYGGMVLVRNIPFVSMCEHHLLPFTGKAHVAYIPSGDDRGDDLHAVLGLSKLARIVEHWARRPQVQERLTELIAANIEQASGSGSVAVLLEAEHMCMSLRGPQVPGHSTITSTLRGAFRSDAKTREEFMLLSNGVRH